MGIGADWDDFSIRVDELIDAGEKVLTVVSLIFLGQVANSAPVYSTQLGERHNIWVRRFVGSVQVGHQLPSPRPTENNEGGFRTELAF
jgi:hypothetical protein